MLPRERLGHGELLRLLEAEKLRNHRAGRSHAKLRAALREWLPEDHLAYFISDVVDQLELSDITVRYEQERRGGPTNHPRRVIRG